MKAPEKATLKEYDFNNNCKHNNETKRSISNLSLVPFYLIWYDSRVQSGTVC